MLPIQDVRMSNDGIVVEEIIPELKIFTKTCNWSNDLRKKLYDVETAAVDWINQENTFRKSLLVSDKRHMEQKDVCFIFLHFVLVISE